MGDPPGAVRRSRPKLAFDSLPQLRKALYLQHPHLAALDTVKPADASAIAELAKGPTNAGTAPFAEAVTDFHLTNPIARASAVMAECASLAKGQLPLAAE